eukprot:scaffold20741_cov91-Skeletonema_dohrnii-CCMP3373.AAC.1
MGILDTFSLLAPFSNSYSIISLGSSKLSVLRCSSSLHMSGSTTFQTLLYLFLVCGHLCQVTFSFSISS